MKNVKIMAVLGIATFTALAAAAASETVTYTYDARGRLVRVVHSGTVNNGLQANYTYDDADNRNTMTVTGAP